MQSNEDLQNVQSITEELMGNTDAVNHYEGVSSNEKPDSTSSEDVCIIDNTENKVCDDATVGEELAFTNDVAVEKPVASQRQSEVVEIFGTAFIEKSPYNALSQDELDSIQRFIFSNDHMKKNIVNVEFNPISSRESSSGCFQHIVGLKIFVKTINLWESPRSYVFRHVGQDTWERGNGSSISIRRIHQK